MPEAPTVSPEEISGGGPQQVETAVAELPPLRVMDETERRAAIDAVVQQLRPKIKQRLTELGASDQPLTPEQLTGIVTYLGQHERTLWSRLLELAPDQRADRYCEVLYENEQVTIWWLNWDKTEGTQIHDHGASQVALYVADGSFVEDYYDPQSQQFIVRKFEAGQATILPSPYIHRVSNHGDQKYDHAVSIHAYSPPLKQMGYYELHEKGGVRLTSEWVVDGYQKPQACLTQL